MGEWCHHRRQLGASNSTTWHRSSGPPLPVARRQRGLRMPSSIIPPSTQDCRAVKSAHLSIGFYFFAGPRQSLRSPNGIHPAQSRFNHCFRSRKYAQPSPSGPAFCACAVSAPSNYLQLRHPQGSDSGPGSSLYTNLRELRVTPEF